MPTGTFTNLSPADPETDYLETRKPKKLQHRD